MAIKSNHHLGLIWVVVFFVITIIGTMMLLNFRFDDEPFNMFDLLAFLFENYVPLSR